MNPCPFCGRTYNGHLCWIDPAHGAYYAALRRGEKPATLVEAEASAPTAVGAPERQLDLFDGAA